MIKVDEIKTAIETLQKEDYVQLRKWFSERDWHDWDMQIGADSAVGNLDFLVKEAFDAKKAGKLKEL